MKFHAVVEVAAVSAVRLAFRSVVNELTPGGVP